MDINESINKKAHLAHKDHAKSLSYKQSGTYTKLMGRVRIRGFTGSICR